MIGNIAGTDVQINIRRGIDGGFQLNAEKQRNAEVLAGTIVGGFERPLIFTIEDNPPQREMSRFLCKMALETFAELFCSEPNGTSPLVDEPYLENIRGFARYGKGFKEWPFSQRRVFPHNTLMRHPDTGEWVQAGFGCGLFMNKRQETFFAFCFYGTEFVINVGGPSIIGYQQWLKDHNGISPMVERLGCHLTTEGNGPSMIHYLHGQFDIKNGLEFDTRHGYSPFR